MLLRVGITKFNIGLARDQPFDILSYICMLIGFFAFVTWVPQTMQKRERDLTLRELRQPYQKSPESFSPECNVLLAFALLGRVGLPDSGNLGALKRLLVPTGTGSYGDGIGAGGCGGGGCGGGGCGGCGG